MTEFDIKAARSRFPALRQDQVFFDNAGGSQTLDTVIDAITDYLSKNNVQLGASYHSSTISTSKYDEGYQAAAKYINASKDEIVLGSSTTQLFMNLSSALQIPQGSEIILSKVDHEANVKPWLHMASRLGLEVKWWAPDGSNSAFALTPASLRPLLSEKTKFVACTHASNILGGIHDIRGIADVCHEAGALFCVDGVAFAPHKAIDVKALGVDFYAFSWYKVYGPHISMLYASASAQDKITPLNHYFNPTDSLSDKLGLAGDCYEAVQSLPHIVEYLAQIGSDAISSHEGALQKILLDFLNKRDDITVHGSTSSDVGVRVPTVSFTVKGKGSRQLVEEAEKLGNFGFRWGHFYSKRLCDEVLGLGEDGVVRVSMVHYNTEEEVQGLIQVLEQVL
ncbi:PLP-dependent transferase [Sporormia fimetaria CBS 119925]|uniref:PLP-dependent transferase n=1 Tax=Sporormia fimetaria CBS 119925 TaxID=1340428 RepID=A0A6A6VEK2_9PLEO|nr:PLP-dependent transferase [Sporormia fimetaria CBS 119925]